MSENLKKMQAKQSHPQALLVPYRAKYKIIIQFLAMAIFPDKGNIL